MFYACISEDLGAILGRDTDYIDFWRVSLHGNSGMEPPFDVKQTALLAA
jgi:hypothetical protein